MSITVVGLGPGSGRYLTREAWEVFTTAGAIYLRTSRHPAVNDLPSAVPQRSFDHIYDSAEKFADVYDQIVEELIRLGQDTAVVYAVPGHPHVGEFTVTKLLEQASAQEIPVRIVAGLSFVEPVLTAVSIDALDGLQIVDALALVENLYPPINANAPLLLGQVYSRLIANEVKLVLSAVYDDQHPVSLIHAAGESDQIVESCALYEIDRSRHIDHLTSLYVPPLSVAGSLPALAETIAVLRSPEGCPWDIEQTPQSMREGFLEEAYEVLQALDTANQVNLREELGDLLYHIVMQAQMASESGEFNLTGIIAGIDAKLKRRHPHVWGDWSVENTAEVLRNWEELKKQEKESSPHSLLDGVPLALPALARSQKIQSRVSKIGFDWPHISGVYEKLAEELRELREANSSLERQSELGDLLFIIVNLARWLDVDAESALREANLRFDQRFRLVEQIAEQRQLDLQQLDLAELDILWEEAKEKLAKAGSGAKV